MIINLKRQFTLADNFRGFRPHLLVSVALGLYIMVETSSKGGYSSPGGQAVEKEKQEGVKAPVCPSKDTMSYECLE